MKLPRRVILSGALMLCLMLAPPSSAVVGLTHPGSTASGYTIPIVLHREGSVLRYANFDLDIHDIRSDEPRANGSARYCALFPVGACPLFYSDVLETAQVGDVYGSDLVPPGSYGFYCSLHPWMRGALVVE